MADRDDERDAASLRDAAWILERRAARKTFAVLVIIRVLRRLAARIDRAGGQRHD